jgi:putative ABC transport system permease protein
MRLWYRSRSALFNLFRRPQIESQLDEEVRAYVDIVTDEKIAKGMPPEEARRQALAECGGMEQVKQAVREGRAGTGIERLWQDVRYTLRQLSRNPAFTWTAVVTLGLGIGATTSIFSAVYALLVRPLPYPQSDQLAYISAEFIPEAGELLSPEFVAAQQGLKSFSQFAGYWSTSSNLTGAGDPERVDWAGVTTNLLPMLGIRPQLGRGFRDDEERPGGPAVILLSDRLWRSYFHADPNVVGKSVAIDGKEQTIIGVLPPHFSFPDFALEPQVYGLADLDPDTSPAAMAKGVFFMHAIGRLRPGVSMQQAQAEVQSLFLVRSRSYPAFLASYWAKRLMVVQPLQTHLAGDDRRPLLILFACVAAVLLIACANVANLQMARALSRRHEMAVRGALGASRYRLMRQSLVESLTLSAFSAALGFAIAWVITTLIRRTGNVADSLSYGRGAQILRLPLGKISTVIHVDGWVLAFTISLALVTALLFGIGPALSGAAGVDLRNALQSGAQRITSGRQQWFLRHALLVLEVALAVVLLCCAGLLMRSFVNVLRYENGFDPTHTLTGTALLSGQRYQSPEAARRFTEQLLSQLETIPGVETAALGQALPLGQVDGDAFSVDNPNPPVGMRDVAPSISITPNYFRAVGTPMLQGRPFTIDDTGLSNPVVIVNSAFARRYFGGDAIGKRFFIGQNVNGAFRFVPTTVVGVTADVRHNGIEHDVQPEFFVPITQIPAYNIDLILRSRIDPALLTSAMRKALTAVDREEPLFDIQTMEERVSNLVSHRRLIMLLISCFALLAILLSAVGIYGVFMYSVSQRRQEMGIRLALGSSRGRLVRLVVIQAAQLILAGGVLGVIVAFLSARLLSSMLNGVTPHDLPSFSLAWALMTLTALLASIFPATNAARTNLISELHSQ